MSRSAYSVGKWTTDHNATTGQKGIFLSRKYLVASVSLFALCVIVIPIIVHVARPGCDKLRPTAPAASVQSTPAVTTVAPTVKDVRLPTDVRPYHYALTLAPFMYGANVSKFYFTGAVNISVQVKSDTSSLKIHTNKLSLMSTPVVIDSSGRNLTVKSVEEDLVRQWQNVAMTDILQAGMNYTILIEKFRGPLKPDLTGLYLSSYMDNGTKKYLTTSQLQPIDARKAFPCFDEPALKARFSVSLVRPHNFKAISNMPSKRNEIVSAGNWFDNASLPWQTVVKEEFETTPIMSTYLLGFVVSQFNHISASDSKGRLYRTWARQDLISLTEFANNTVVQVTEHFERYFNIAYPLNKTDQAALPDFAAGAMENWGLVLYREARLLLDKNLDKSSDKQSTARIISHEMAHMWFGNLVTAEWWDDIWLNEGFASFIQSLGVDYLHPDWEIDAQFVVTRQLRAFQLDSGSSSHPIYLPVHHPNEINQIFDSITYDKGSSVLRMLYYAIGSEVFRIGVSNYLKMNSYSNTYHTDLYHCLDEQAGASGNNVNVTSMMDTWIRQMGYPVVTCTKENTNELLLSQQHFLSDPSQSPDPKYPSPFNFTWIIPITMMTKDNSSSWNRTEVSHIVQWMGSKSQRFSISSTASWYLLNLRSTGFYRVNYDTENWNALINQLLTDHAVFTPHDRARLIDDSFTLASAGYINYSIPLSITQYLKNETHFVPWKSALSKLSYIDSMLYRQAPEYGPFSKYMKSLLNPIYEKVGTQQKITDSHLTRLTRELIVPAACRYDIYSCKSNVGALFQTFVNSSFSQRIDPDIQRAALCVGIANSDADEWNNLFERRSRETHPGTQHDIIRALACSQRPWLLNYYLSLTLDDSKVRRQDASTVISSISKNPIGLQIVWDFLRNNWSTISSHHSGLFSLPRYIKNLGDFNTIYRLREMEAFKEENKETLATASRAFDAAVANVRINVKWMQVNRKYVRKLVIDLLGNQY